MDKRDHPSWLDGATPHRDVEGTIEFAELREDIRQVAARRRERGDLPPDADLDLLQAKLWVEVAATSLASSLPVAAGADFDRPSSPDLAFTLEECEILPTDYQIGWRNPIAGPIHAALRRQINAEVRRYVDEAFRRQTRLNYRFSDLIQRIVRDHGIALDQLRDQLSQAGGLRMELDALRAQIGLLQAELRGLHAETRSLDRAAGYPRGDEAVSLDYLAYNQWVGGGPEHERALYAEFLPHFAGARGPVVDLGCGRAPFLDLLRAASIPAFGVDRDPRMVSYARSLGHRVIETDALAFLATSEEGTLGGIFAAHLIEHLPRAGLVDFVERCRRALAPGACAIFITPDPRSLFVLSDTFYKDLTHVAPIHPEALTFLVEQAGFASHEVRTLSPVPEERRLEGEDSPGVWSSALRRNLAKVEELLFGDLDYALIARS